MMRRERKELEHKLAQTRRLAQEPTDPFTRERLAQLIEDLEFQLEAGRLAASADAPLAGAVLFQFL